MKELTSVIRNDERVIFDLRSLYQQFGYSQYKMSKFEAYDLYVRNKDFLVSDHIITFNDTDGTLMAMKPDVTLSIIKNTKDIPGYVQKVYYNENVYRVPKGTHTFKEIMQVGLECIGDIDLYQICEVIMLAADSLQKVSEQYILDISHLGIIAALLQDLPISSADNQKIVQCIGEKNLHSLQEFCLQLGIDTGRIEELCAVVKAYGSMESVYEQLKQSLKHPDALDALEELKRLSEVLEANGYGEKIRFDFSIVNNMNYYNGIMFRGFVEGIASGILSGGQYDNLMKKMGKRSGAIGFAVYLDLLERISQKEKEYDVDTLLLYDDTSEAQDIINGSKMFRTNGKDVLALKTIPEKLTYRQCIRIQKGGFEIIENHD